MYDLVPFDCHGSDRRTGRYSVLVLHDGPAPGPIDLATLGFPETALLRHAMRHFRQFRRVPDWPRVIEECGGIDGPSRSGCTGRLIREAIWYLRGNRVSDVGMFASCEGAEMQFHFWDGRGCGGSGHRLQVRPQAIPAIRTRLRLLGAALARDFRRQAGRPLPPTGPRLPHRGPHSPQAVQMRWRGHLYRISRW